MSSRRKAFVAALWLAASACVWVALVDWYLRSTDSSFKRWAILASLPLLGLAALWAARALATTRWRFLPPLVLLLTGLAQCEQAALRWRYRAAGPTRSVGPAASLLRPFTTTDLVTTYYELPTAWLQTERLRVVEVTDLHVVPALPLAYYASVLDRVRAQRPDLILLTGDLVSSADDFGLLARVLGQGLRAPLGVFAVLGNHDYWTNAEQVRRILGSAGATLVGPCQRLPAAVGRISVCGTDAPWGSDLEGALDPSGLSIVLSHTPDNIYRLADLGASVVFSGHTHGGQGRIPGLGAIIVPSSYGSRFDLGHFRVGATDLFVSAGVGADSPPLRVYCRPDIVVVDLIKSRR